MGNNFASLSISPAINAHEDKRLEALPMDDECEQFQQDFLGSMRQMTAKKPMQYVAERGQLPFQSVLMAEDDEALVLKVTERLTAPQRVKILLDDL